MLKPRILVFGSSSVRLDSMDELLVHGQVTGDLNFRGLIAFQAPCRSK